MNIDEVLRAHGIGEASGTATPAQVLSGYTFTANQGYKTGTMPNNGSPTLIPGQSITPGYYSGGTVSGTQFASGSATSSTTAQNASDYGGNAKTAYPLTITGLSFQPSRIVAICQSQGICDVAVVDVSDNFYTGATYVSHAFYSSIGSNDPVQLSNGYQVTSSGFTIPVGYAGDTYNWYAYK